MAYLEISGIGADQQRKYLVVQGDPKGGVNPNFPGMLDVYRKVLQIQQHMTPTENPYQYKLMIYYQRSLSLSRGMKIVCDGGDDEGGIYTQQDQEGRPSLPFFSYQDCNIVMQAVFQNPNEVFQLYAPLKEVFAFRKKNTGNGSQSEFIELPTWTIIRTKGYGAKPDNSRYHDPVTVVTGLNGTVTFPGEIPYYDTARTFLPLPDLKSPTRGEQVDSTQ